jgi:putative oxidoreductase
MSFKFPLKVKEILLYMKKQTVVNITSYLLILLFAYTGFSKLLVYATFKMQLERQPLTSNVAPTLAIILPVVEIVIASILLIPRLQKWGFRASFFLMLLFTLYVGYMLAFVPTNSLPCSCGGIIKEMSWKQHLVFNIVFTAIALVGLRYSTDKMPQKNDDSNTIRYA